MSDEIFDEDTPLVKQLRDQLKEANKTLKGFEAEITEFRAAKRTATLAQTLEAKGVNPKVAKLIPADIEADKIDEWIVDYADVFGLRVVEEAETPPDAEQLARQRVSQVEAAAESAPNDIAQRLNQAQSADEIIALINSGGRF